MERRDGPRWRRLLPIRRAVYLVGVIPIFVAALITLAALYLLERADVAREGAVEAATIYRNIVSAIGARDEFSRVAPPERERARAAFDGYVAEAKQGFSNLVAVTGGEDLRAVGETSERLSTYVDEMAALDLAARQTDALLARMNQRLSVLLRLSDEARARQHRSNTEVVAALDERNKLLRLTRELVDRAQVMRAALADLGRAGRDVAVFVDAARLANARTGLLDALAQQDRQAAEEFRRRFVDGAAETGAGEARLRAELQWIDRLLKVHGPAERAMQDSVAELLTYTVQAHETEQATQTIAIETMKLGQRMGEVVTRRDDKALVAILDDSRRLSEAIAAQPISPLIQTEMLDALDRWIEGLDAARMGLGEQNAILSRMQGAADLLLADVAALDRRLAERSDGIGQAVRQLLLLGAAFGLVLGSATAGAVAHSITVPLRRLADRMIALAANPAAGPVGEIDRPDELGSMARATTYFVGEIAKREAALREAKEAADRTLAELRRTQDDLVQAGKLASLGQLVAGVAHEINTPLGVALTTATVTEDEVRRFEQSVEEGKVARAAFERFVSRMREGTRLVHANLARAADLVHSFKQIATDQASGERRRFSLRASVDDLFTSLGPMIKRSGHAVAVGCAEDVEMDGYPGALAQVLTNLLTNAFAHAFPEGAHGRIEVRIAPSGPGEVRIEFSDNGAGIPLDQQRRVFEPFFTTRRSAGSTGLGLHIVFNLVNGMLGGRIALDSAPGAGTRFIIDLPRMAPDPRALPLPAPPAALPALPSAA